MQMSEVISSRARLLLTSAGPTTEAIQDGLRALAHTAINPKKVHILRVADGWSPFQWTSGATLRQELKQRAEGLGARVWSHKYLKYVLGRAAVIDTMHGTAHPDALTRWSFRNAVEDADMLLVPGGNTYQAMNGLKPHIEIIGKKIKEGLPYIGESAGSIVAGLTLRPAALKPADIKPSGLGRNADIGLCFIHADIIPHAPGSEGEFAIQGLQSAIAGRLLRHHETLPSDIETYRAEKTSEHVPAYVLHDKQALFVADSQINVI